MRYRLPMNFIYSPDCFFQQRELKATGDTANLTATTHISYTELPVNLVYKPLLGNGHLLLGFGPYVAYGIMGKLYNEKLWDESEEWDVDFKNKVTADDPENVRFI